MNKWWWCLIYLAWLHKWWTWIGIFFNTTSRMNSIIFWLIQFYFLLIWHAVCIHRVLIIHLIYLIWPWNWYFYFFLYLITILYLNTLFFFNLITFSINHYLQMVLIVCNDSFLIWLTQLLLNSYATPFRVLTFLASHTNHYLTVFFLLNQVSINLSIIIILHL